MPLLVRHTLGLWDVSDVVPTDARGLRAQCQSFTRRLVFGLHRQEGEGMNDWEFALASWLITILFVVALFYIFT